jgi:hypothetical protein
MELYVSNNFTEMDLHEVNGGAFFLAPLIPIVFTATLKATAVKAFLGGIGVGVTIGCAYFATK